MQYSFLLLFICGKFRTKYFISQTKYEFIQFLNDLIAKYRCAFL